MKSAFHISQDQKQAMRNPWVLGWLAGVGVVLAVNAGFIITAITTNPGLVVENYYEKGQDHERTMQSKIETRQRLDWDMQIQNGQPIIVGKSSNIYFDLKDRDGVALDVDSVKLTAYRPADASADFSMNMESIAPGRYIGVIKLPLKGLWELQVTASQGEDRLEIQKRIHAQISDQ